MSPEKLFERLTSAQTIALRPTVERPAPGELPLDVVDEWEASGPEGNPVRVRTIFLRGSECRFHCVMCDLWQFTHLVPPSPGAIAAQVDAGGLQRSPPAPDQPAPTWIKLYNASSFFDSKNVPTDDLPVIAQRVSRFDRVIVENHPRTMPWQRVNEFQRRLGGQLEIAMGLETIEPYVLARLNKQMTADDFADAARACRRRQIDVRAFVLLRPPWLDEQTAVDWCRRSIDFAIEHGARHVSVIPTRGGNGAMEWLRKQGEFEPPLASSLERVLSEFRLHPACVVTADLWNWDKLRGTCPKCHAARRARLERINLMRSQEPILTCEACNVRGA